MNCNECGVTNKEDARFCSNCGAALAAPEQVADHNEQDRKTRACPACRHDNPEEGRYCGACGVDMRRPHTIQHKHRHEQAAGKKMRGADTRLKWHPAIVVLAIIGGCAIILTLPYIFGLGSSPQQTAVEQRSVDPHVETRVTAIASRFSCSCGTCGELSLGTCTCGRAIEERTLIRNRVQAGQSDSQIVETVNSIYGFLKEEYKEQPGTKSKGKENARKSSPSDILPLSQRTSESPSFVIATQSDRTEVFSHFRCPCGQCGIDELKDCSCNHPRGAQEVKRFIDEKISEDRYAVNQLIALVEQKYGNRKY
ncbi:MAG: zinc ribbon domain-containing protein [Ignavibacteriales bacterium]|nr:zinc ribbon domain-containing protein [Ignavibacteriales bacterium]